MDKREIAMFHVLIIEDDAIAAIDIRDALIDEGASSFSFAETERDAVRCAQETRPDFITSDVMLSTGFGPAAVGAIHAEFGAIPVIFITGTPEQCGDHPTFPVLEKPFDPARLVAEFHVARTG